MQKNGFECWFLAALITLSSQPYLVESLCAARDEECGIYGFVFCRDGSWTYEVVDDRLFLDMSDYHEHEDFLDWDDHSSTPDNTYKNVMQTGSVALFFSRCRNKNETWLPLLEKAYANMHGDYSSLNYGGMSEALEDLTGGVASRFQISDLLHKDKFWADLQASIYGKVFFGVGSHNEMKRTGIKDSHAYLVLEVRECKGYRLVKLSYASLFSLHTHRRNFAKIRYQESMGQERWEGTLGRWVRGMETRGHERAQLSIHG